MKENNKFVNEDTYQTLTEIKTESNPYDKAIVPMWKKEKCSLFIIYSNPSP